MGMDRGLKQLAPLSPMGILGGFRGSEIQKSGITTKRVDQLAQHLVHVCIFNWECPRYHKGRGNFGVLGGQNFIKSLRNAMICREKMKINYVKMKCTN